MSEVQKFLANEGGIHKRRFDRSSVPSASATGAVPSLDACGFRSDR
jgi:hypothetical protein